MNSIDFKAFLTTFCNNTFDVFRWIAKNIEGDRQLYYQLKTELANYSYSGYDVVELSKFISTLMTIECVDYDPTIWKFDCLDEGVYVEIDCIYNSYCDAEYCGWNFVRPKQVSSIKFEKI